MIYAGNLTTLLFFVLSSNSEPIVFAALCCISSVTCIYVFIVNPASVWPSIWDTVFMSMPCSSDRVAKLCLKSWNLILGNDAFGSRSQVKINPFWFCFFILNINHSFQNLFCLQATTFRQISRKDAPNALCLDSPKGECFELKQQHINYFQSFLSYAYSHLHKRRTRHFKFCLDYFCVLFLFSSEGLLIVCHRLLNRRWFIFCVPYTDYSALRFQNISLKHQHSLSPQDLLLIYLLQLIKPYWHNPTVFIRYLCIFQRYIFFIFSTLHNNLKTKKQQFLLIEKLLFI